MVASRGLGRTVEHFAGKESKFRSVWNPEVTCP